MTFILCKSMDTYLMLKFVKYENHPLIARILIIAKYSISIFFVTCKNQIFHNDKHTLWWSMTFILHESMDTHLMLKFMKYENYPSIARILIIVKYSTHLFFVACENQIFCNDTYPSWWRMIVILHELNQ